MAAEDNIEDIVFLRGMLIAIPPAPIRTLGDIYLLPGLIQFLLISLRIFILIIDQRCTGGPEQVPGAVVLLMTDPNLEVVTDSGTGKQVGYVLLQPGFLEQFRNCDGFETIIIGKPLIERIQEIQAVIGEIFPGVLPVQDNRYGVILDFGRFQERSDRGQMIDEIGRRLVRVPGGINKADTVGETVIAENYADFPERPFEHKGLMKIQPVGRAFRLGFGMIYRLKKDFLIGGNPFDPTFRQNRQETLRYTPL